MRQQPSTKEVSPPHLQPETVVPLKITFLAAPYYKARTTPRNPSIPAAAKGRWVGAANAEEVVLSAAADVVASLDAALDVVALAEASMDDTAAETEPDRLERIDEASAEPSDMTLLAAADALLAAAPVSVAGELPGTVLTIALPAESVMVVIRGAPGIPVEAAPRSSLIAESRELMLG